MNIQFSLFSFQRFIRMVFSVAILLMSLPLMAQEVCPPQVMYGKNPETGQWELFRYCEVPADWETSLVLPEEENISTSSTTEPSTPTQRLPNDPFFPELWGLQKIQAPEAWTIATGGEVIVAELSTGIDYTHPDLKDNMWVNPNEIPGNGIDDDGNGCLDDVYGCNVTQLVQGSDGKTYFSGDPQDDYYHGTHVAGIIGATGNNGLGISGVNWSAKLMAVKSVSYLGFANFTDAKTSDAILAIEYALKMGAKIINASWHIDDDDQPELLREAIRVAGEQGVLVIAGAGNRHSNQNIEQYPQYPASYDLDNIITVAATTENDELAAFSNYGNVSVDLGAPGMEIYSTVPTDYQIDSDVPMYVLVSGTSMATPYVTGAAALLWSAFPNLTASEVKAYLLDNVDKQPSLEGKTVTGGRLNVYRAMMAAKEASTPPTTSSRGQAIIIAAGGAKPENTLFSFTHDYTQRIYRLLKERGFNDDEIRYMDPHFPDIDLDGYPDEQRRDYKLIDPAQELEEVFNKTASQLKEGQQFLLYLHGHARPGYLKLNSTYELSAQHLNELLNRLPPNVPQILIIDSCYSGSLLSVLKHPSRIILTSTDDFKKAWNMKYTSFSENLINQIQRGNNLGEAFKNTENNIINDPRAFRDQRPWLDDDGDGQYTTKDGLRALETFIGGEGVAGADLPEIALVHPHLTLPGTSAKETLWVRVFPAPDFIHQVRAVIISPDSPVMDYEGETTDFSRLELTMTYNPAQDRYEVVYDRFCTGGTWQISYQAQDKQGLWSEPKFGEVESAANSQDPVCYSPMTVTMHLNQTRYTVGDTLRLDMSLQGTGLADVYVAIVFPDNSFMTLNYPLSFNFPNTTSPYLTAVDLSASKLYPVLELVLPPGLATGNYSACGVLVKPNEINVLDPNQWIHWHCAGLELY